MPLGLEIAGVEDAEVRNRDRPALDGLMRSSFFLEIRTGEQSKAARAKPPRPPMEIPVRVRGRFFRTNSSRGAGSPSFRDFMRRPASSSGDLARSGDPG